MALHNAVCLKKHFIYNSVLWKESFWEECCVGGIPCGRNPLEGFPCGRNPKHQMWEKSCIGGIPSERNLIWEESCRVNFLFCKNFVLRNQCWRNHVLEEFYVGGILCGRNPVWEESCARGIHLLWEEF